MGTRYDEMLAPLYWDQFKDYKDCFQMAYQEGNTIYTHAGISNKWWEKDFFPLVDKSSIQYDNGIMNVADILNNATPQQLQAMFQVGLCSGGYDAHGGIFWADMSETYNDSLTGFHQMVGHSKITSVQTFDTDPQTQISFCDGLQPGAYLTKSYEPSL